MKRKKFNLIVVSMVLAIVMSACGKGDADVLVESVKLDQSTATLEVNNTLTLTATVEPLDALNPLVKWTSSDASIATVSAGPPEASGVPSNKGIVTAKAPGTALIMVTTEDGGFIATCKVNVTFSNLTLNKTTLSLVTGASEKLTASLVPPSSTEKISWTSDNPAIASVGSDGTVTALTVGTTTIKATTQDGQKSATCQVTVTKAPVPVTGISLNHTTYTLYTGSTGNTVELKATVIPLDASNQKVSWASKNTAIATVNTNGVVSAVAAGTVIITATTEEGGKVAECTITVKTPVTGVSLNKYTLTLTVNEKENLVATITPANASNKTLKWSSSNPAIASVDSNVVTAKVAGTATIIVTTQDGGFSASCNVTVNALYTPVASITLPTTLTVQGSDKGSLTATMLPLGATDKRVKWTSSDINIVPHPTGDGLTCEIIPKAPTTSGDRTVIITVTSVDVPTIKAECEVTIKYIPVNAITMPATYTLNTAMTTTPLTYTVSPANASIKDISWSSNATGVVTVTPEGLLVRMSSGTAIIKATSVAVPTIFRECTVTVP
ncbi:MAG: Ig-like domain-containing protein [Tannerella sp.]|jgi:uncharacterized protein YjdB|nr:Ig-like domain-containing protein [Tannerella sp.]